MKNCGLLFFFFVPQVTGRALRDSVRIVTKFSDMEKAYSSHNSLRFVTHLLPFQLHVLACIDLQNTCCYQVPGLSVMLWLKNKGHYLANYLVCVNN